ncbi:MAG: hypothetical protein OFPI_02490 [Osedax symbiont Rs2]|nr:MAG: hypothetical protein OFPI_02490 [Osedax symbiont Rs2]
MLKNLLLTVTIALTLSVPTTQAVAAGITHNKRIQTPALRKPIISPGRAVIRRTHWNNYSYSRGYYVATGIILGLVIADINSVAATSIVSFAENGVTYFVVNGQKCVLVSGQFVAVS